MKKIAAAMATLALAGAVLAGCSKPAEKPATTPAATTPAQPEIAKPASTTYTGKSADGKLEVKLVVAGKVASVEMTTKDWTWMAPPAKDAKNEAGKGHAQLIVDTKDPVTASQMRHSLSGLEVGKHTLTVKLANNDKTATSTEAKIEFEVK